MKVWEKLMKHDWNDAYDMWENPKDVLEEYRFAIVDLGNENIFEVARTKEELFEELEVANGFEYYTDDLNKLAVLNIETDEIYVAETTITWQKYLHTV